MRKWRKLANLMATKKDHMEGVGESSVLSDSSNSSDYRHTDKVEVNVGNFQMDQSEVESLTKINSDLLEKNESLTRENDSLKQDICIREAEHKAEVQRLMNLLRQKNQNVRAENQKPMETTAEQSKVVQRYEEQVRALKNTISTQEALVNELLTHNSNDAEKTALLEANRRQQNDIEKLSCLLSAAESECKNLSEAYQHVKNNYLDDNSEKNSLIKRIEFMKKEVDELKNIIDARQAENEQIRNEACDWRNRFETSERSLEEVRAQLSAAQKAAEESDSRNYVLGETVQKLQEDRGRLEVCADQTDPPDSEVDQLKQFSEQKEVDIDKLRNEVDEWKARKVLLDLKMTRLKQCKGQIVDRIEDARYEVYEMMDKFQIAETSLDKVRAQLSAAQQAAEESDCLMFQLQEENLDLEEKLAKSEKRETTLKDQNGTLCSEMKDLQLALEQNQAEIEQMKSDIRYLLSEVAKLELLKSKTEGKNRILSAKAEQLECEKQKEQAETLRQSGLVSEFESRYLTEKFQDQTSSTEDNGFPLDPLNLEVHEQKNDLGDYKAEIEKSRKEANVSEQVKTTMEVISDTDRLTQKELLDSDLTPPDLESPSTTTLGEAASSSWYSAAKSIAKGVVGCGSVCLAAYLGYKFVSQT
ncbi:hypothetical protein WMY93_028223 [Mugilogobius chulae]|uniref:Uncharacterized protein n=1 Tax=Mugilogobius chulae TaxID=88201 RepID=A0AAW0MWC9_9GOBI